MKKVDIEFEVNGKKVAFSVLSNIGDAAETIIMSWALRTKKHTAASFCAYVNKKGVHKAKELV